MRHRILQGDALAMLRRIKSGMVQTCVTSPPYWGLRDYGVSGQLGLETTPEEYVAKLVEVFQEIRRVLRDDGTLWLNLGDSYVGLKPPPGLKNKDLAGIPWRVALALQADGWYLRSDIIWAKPNPIPESVTDRPTKAHEYIFLFAKSERYFFDATAITEPRVDLRDPGNRQYYDTGRPDGLKLRPNRGAGPTRRNRRTVWTVSTKPFKGAHFATFPPGLIEPCVLAGAPVDGVVLDPFNGAGTTGVVALKHGRRYIGIELNPEYVAMAEKRIQASLSASKEDAA